MWWFLLSTALAASDPIVLPSRMCGGLFLVQVGTVDPPLSMILDTGANVSVIDPDALERADGERVATGRTARVKTLAIGEFTAKGVRLKVEELDHVGRALRTRVDGIIGFPVFQAWLLTLDYPAGEVRVSRGRAPREALTLIDRGTDRPVVDLQLGRQRLEVLLDSGATHAITLRREDIETWAVPPRPLSASAQFDTITTWERGRLAEEVGLGPFRFAAPEAKVTDAWDGTRLVGAAMLRHGTWVFDPKHRRVHVLPATLKHVPPEPWTGTGASLSPRADGLEVVHIAPGTPASEFLELGDLVVAVDGTPVYERGCRDLDAPQPASLLYAVRRGEEQLDVRVPVEPLIP